jgi:ParB family chromosome partitioning protein
MNRTLTLPLTDIDPDPNNRMVAEDEDFQTLVDSVRVLGVLQAVHVWKKPDGRFQLIDGERRWRAAQKAGLAELAGEVWPEKSPHHRTLAGVVLNEHRQPAGCLSVARRLREVKSELGLSHEELAGRTGLPLDRIKTYFALFGASDGLLQFFEQSGVALKVAVEFVRYEKATNEASARKLASRYLRSPLSVAALIRTRKKRRQTTSRDAARQSLKLPRLLDQLDAALRRDPKGVVLELERVLGPLGYYVVAGTSEEMAVTEEQP